jgi:hypothetical protein
MDRVVSQLLTELDGMQGNTNVFVIGATNRPDLLDQSLLRPGRFDRLIYLGIASDRDSQRKIVGALSRKFKLDPDVHMDTILAKCPLTFTGADFYALCSGALAHALKRRVAELQAHIASLDPELMMTPRKLLAGMSEEELDVTVKHDDYLNALATTVPSVSADEIRHYESLREQFSGGGGGGANATKGAVEQLEDQMNQKVAETESSAVLNPITDSTSSHRHAGGHFENHPIPPHQQQPQAPTLDPYNTVSDPVTGGAATVADVLRHQSLGAPEEHHSNGVDDPVVSDANKSVTRRAGGGQKSRRQRNKKGNKQDSSSQHAPPQGRKSTPEKTAGNKSSKSGRRADLLSSSLSPSSPSESEPEYERRFSS